MNPCGNVSEAAADIAEGNLGPTFNAAEALGLAEVAQILRAKEDDMARRDAPGAVSQQQLGAITATREHAEALLEHGATSAVVTGLDRRTLRKRIATAAPHPQEDSQFEDAFTDAAQMPPPANPVFAVQPLLPFEAVALASLMPRTLEEAVALVPSLRYYHEVDLAQLVHDLRKGIL